MQAKYAVSSILLISFLTACGGSGSDSDALTLDDGSVDTASPEADIVSSDADADSTEIDTGNTDADTVDSGADTGSTSAGTADVDEDTGSANIETVNTDTGTVDSDTDTANTTIGTANIDTDTTSTDTTTANTDTDTTSTNTSTANTDTDTSTANIDADTTSTDTGTANTDTDTTSTDTSTANTDTDTTNTDTSTANIDTDTTSTDTSIANIDTDTTSTDTTTATIDADTDTTNTDTGTVTSNIITCCLQEDRTAPAPGTVVTSATAPVVSNNVADVSNTGPQPISATNNNSFPGLRYGNLLLLNNAFNAGNQRWNGWSQSISLNDGSPVTAEVVWDWGLESQKFQPFETIAFPELVYGTKSAAERSGTFAETGLPVEEANRPDISITYNYNRVAGVTQAPLGENDTGAEAADSEHNVIIESFWHDSCDIVRNGSPEDNNVMELLLWYYHGERLPSGPSDIVDTGVLIDGQLWTVYAKASNFNFLAYVAEDVETAERQSGTINYSAFIQHMLDNDERYGVYQVQPTDCFANILFGPEVFQGAGSFTFNDFTITRQY